MIFKYKDREFHAMLREGETWFDATDTCAILAMGNPYSSLALLDEDEKGLHIVETLGGKQDKLFITEPGLYSLILRSRKAEAKEFKRWVTHEVLRWLYPNYKDGWGVRAYLNGTDQDEQQYVTRENTPGLFVGNTGCPALSTRASWSCASCLTWWSWRTRTFSHSPKRGSEK